MLEAYMNPQQITPLIFILKEIYTGPEIKLTSQQ